MLNLLRTFFTKPKTTAPGEIRLDIVSYGQESSGLPFEQIQDVMKWLGLSLIHSGYRGKSHLIWYDSGKPDAALEQAVWTGMRRSEPTFLYRCSPRTMPPPSGRYWRMMSEHPSMRIYQLEVRDEN